MSDEVTRVVRRPPPETPEGTPSSSGYLGRENLPLIAGYDLICRLGQGGMGVVYLARDRQLDRMVALKMIRFAAHAEVSDLVRFQIEAKAVAALHHPGIVQLYDSGQSEGLPYFTLEYLSGGSLAERVATQPLAPTEAAKIVHTLAEAMAYAHSHDIIHRDLKPENVLFAEDGTPRVTDFGLARLAEGSGATRTRDVMGTPDYMAPEQARGGSAHVGPAADVWALGAILYRLITGRPPFEAATGMDTLRLVLDADPVPLRTLVASCPTDLETIALKCLKKPLIRRYASAQDLADDLGRFLEGQPIHARPVSAAERLARWVMRNPLVTFLLTTTFLALVVGTVISSVLAVRANTAAALAEQRRVDADRATVVAQQAVLDEAAARAELAQELRQSRSSQFSAQLARLGPRVERSAFEARKELLDPEMFPPDLRDPAWGLMLAQTQRGLWHLPTTRPASHGAQAVAYAFDPTGQILVRAEPGYLRILDAFSGRQFSGARPMDGDPVALVFSKDGRHLFGLDGTTLYQWEMMTLRQVRRCSPGGQSLRHLLLTPAEDEAILGGRQSPIWSIPLQGEAAPRRLTEESAENGLALSPDGATLALGGPVLRLIDRATGRRTAIERNGGVRGGSTCLAFSGEGRLLAVGDANGCLCLYDLATRRELFALPGRGGRFGITALTFHPTLPALAVQHATETVLHDLVDGRDLAVLPALGMPAWLSSPLVFRPDGTQLLYLDQQITPTLADTVARPAALTTQLADTSSLAYGSDNGTLIALGSGGRIHERSTASGEYLRSWPSASGTILATSTAREQHRLALLTETGVEIRHLGTGDLLTSFQTEGTGRNLALSPDASRVATVEETAGRMRIQVRDIQGNRILWSKQTEGKTLAWDREGDRLALPAQGGLGITFHAGETGEEVQPGIVSPDPVERLVYLPDGTLLGLVGYRRLILWDPRTGKELRRIGNGFPVLSDLEVSSDGRTAVTFGADRRLRMWDLATGRLRHTWNLAGDAADIPGLNSSRSILFRPDGQQLALLTLAHDGAVLRMFDTPWRGNAPAESTWASSALALRRRLVEQQQASPWDPVAYERQVPVLVEQGQPDRAALYLAWSAWQRYSRGTR